MTCAIGMTERYHEIVDKRWSSMKYSRINIAE